MSQQKHTKIEKSSTQYLMNKSNSQNITENVQGEEENRQEKIEKIAKETIQKKQQLEEILKILDSDANTYPSAKTLFTKEEDFLALTKKNKRDALCKYETLLSNFSDAVLQCDKVAALQEEGDATQEIKEENNGLTEKKEELNDKNVILNKTEAEIIDLENKIQIETDEDKKQDLILEKNVLEAEKKSIENKKIVLEQEIQEIENYIQKSKILLKLKDFNAKEESDVEKQNIIEFIVGKLVEKGATKDKLYLEKEISGQSYRTLNSVEAQKLIKNKFEEIGRAKNIIDEKDKKRICDARRSSSNKELLDHLYNTISEGRFRVFISVLGNIIGENGLFPTKKSVLNALNGKNVADELSSAGKTDNQESNAKFLGGMLSAIGGKEGDFKNSVSTLEKTIAEYKDGQSNKEIKEKLNLVKTFEEQEKVKKIIKDNTLSKENLDDLSDASFETIKTIGDTLSSVSDDLNYFSEGNLKEENINSLSSLNVKERDNNSSVTLKDDRAKRMKLAKAMRGISALSKIVSAGSNVACSKFGKLADNKKDDGLKVLSEPIPPKPVPPFTESKPSRGEDETQESFDLRMYKYQKALENYTEQVRKYDEAMVKYNEDKQAYEKNVVNGIHYNQDPNKYKSEHQLFNAFDTAEKASSIISYGSKTVGNIADVVASASEMSYYKDNINKLQKQAVNVLSHLKIKDTESNNRKDNILIVLRGSNFLSKNDVAPSNKTKKKLNVFTALDEMQVNMEYKLSNEEKKKLALAAATSRACLGIKYKKDVSSLSLAGSSISMLSNASITAANFSSIVSPVLAAPFLFVGAIFGITSAIFNVYSKKNIEKKKKIRNKQLGQNISSMMKVLFNMKDSSGNLPTLKVLDNTVIDSGGEIKYSDDATLDNMDQAENSVAAFDLLTGAGIDIDGVMVAAVKGVNAKNNSSGGSTSEDDELDLIDLNKDDKDEGYYKKLILSKLANV